MTSTRIVSILFVVTLVAVGGYFLAGGNVTAPVKLTPPGELAAVIEPRPQPLEGFELRGQGGETIDPAWLQGHWTFLFFGYTHCPDVCPTTLAILRATVTRLEQESPEYLNRVRTLFVSVDPKRDTPEGLRRFLGYFHPSFVGATGERTQIDTLARQAGAIYAFEGDTSGDDYIVNHSATIVVVDPEGRMYARLNPPHAPAQMAETFRHIRDFAGN